MVGALSSLKRGEQDNGQESEDALIAYISEYGNEPAVQPAAPEEAYVEPAVDSKSGPGETETTETGEAETQPEVPGSVGGQGIRRVIEARVERDAPGLTPQQKEDVINLLMRQQTDTVTGWVDARGGDVKSELSKQIDEDVSEGMQVAFISMDLANLGGLNDFYKNISEDSNRAFREIMAIVADQFAGFENTAMRTGGDEFGMFVYGLTARDAEARMDKARELVHKYAKDHGFHDIKHSKGKPTRGVSVYSASVDLGMDMTANKAYRDTEARMKEMEDAKAKQSAGKSGRPDNERDVVGQGESAPQPRGPERTRTNAGDDQEGANEGVDTSPTPTPQTPADAGVSVSGDLVFRTDGTPYKSKKAAEAGRNRADLKGKMMEAVELDGGWALRDVREQVAAEDARLTTETAGNLRNGDIIRNDKGDEFLALGARHDWLEAAPIVDGKAQVSADTTFKFLLTPEKADSYPERRNEPVYATGRNLYDESKSPAAQKKAEPTKQETPAKPANRIGDFGETIEGSRKDLASKMKAAMDKDVSDVPLSQSWPEPNYQKMIDDGIDPWVVAAVRALRDEVPAKPRRYVKRWAEQVETLRGLAFDLIEGKKVERVKSTLKESGPLEKLVGRIELYETFGHDNSFKGIGFSKQHWSIRNGERDVTLSVVEQYARKSSFGNMPREIATGKTKQEALDNFKKAIESGGLNSSKNAKNPRFDVYSYRAGPKSGKWYIGKKIGRNHVDLESFDTSKEAIEYLRNNPEKLAEKLARLKDIPAHRMETSSPRVGVDHRNGQDVTPEMFSESFGFRGVQFGNYVEQGKRQQDLNEAYDALMDLAGVLGVPSRALSLNGELGLAFGARGKGKRGKITPAAHYEANHIVINLTKKKGAGSLAHEWWHALDNYFVRERGAGAVNVYSTESAPHKTVRPEVRQAFFEVVRAINRTKLKQRSAILDSVSAKDYWSTGAEMSARAFESYVIEKLRDQGAANDYLANIVSPEYWAAAEALAREKEGSYPYPEAAEIPVIRAAFDNFFQVVETKETGDGNVALFSLAEDDSLPPNIDRRIIGDDPVLLGWTMLARNDDVFRLDTSNKKSVPAIINDLIARSEVSAVNKDFAESADADVGWEIVIRAENGDVGIVHVFQKGKSVWLDVSALSPGQSGSEVYNAIANYAFNTDRVLIGDPAGLSDIALSRRLENMISSALKFGTTRHLWPHGRQVKGDSARQPGDDSIVPGITWKDGDDVHNLRQMIGASYQAVRRQFPEMRDLRYNPESDVFEDVKTGKEWTRDDFNEAARELRAGASGQDHARGKGGVGGAATAGGTTLERAVFTQTLLSAESGEVRGRLLERLGSLGSERLVGLLYSESSEARPSAGLSGSGLSDPAPQAKSVAAAVREALGGLAGRVKVVQSVADIPEAAGVSLMTASTGRIEGMYDPASDQIYLVADGLRNTDRAVWVAWHELFHRGVRHGKEGQALRQSLNRADLNKSIHQLADAIARDRGLDQSSRAVAVEEALAELNAADETGNYDQIQRRYGVTVPDSMKKGIRGHIARFVEAVKNVLSKVLGREVTNDAEVWAILRQAREGYDAQGEAVGATDMLASQTPETRAAYEARIDELVSGAERNRRGVKVLDRADILDLLGHSNKPLHLVESAVEKLDSDGKMKHQGMTAEQWKRVPDWIENPVAAFRSDTVDGRLTLIAPELVDGKPVLIVLQPNGSMGGLNAHVLVNAYEKDNPGKVPTKRWVDEQKLLYLDQKKSPEVGERSGLRLPGDVRQLRGYKQRVLTENDLFKYRQSADGQMYSLAPAEETYLPSTGPRIERGIVRLAKLKGWFMGAADTLLETKGLEHVGEAVREYFDGQQANRSKLASVAPHAGARIEITRCQCMCLHRTTTISVALFLCQLPKSRTRDNFNSHHPALLPQGRVAIGRYGQPPVQRDPERFERDRNVIGKCRYPPATCPDIAPVFGDFSLAPLAGRGSGRGVSECGRSSNALSPTPLPEGGVAKPRHPLYALHFWIQRMPTYE